MNGHKENKEKMIASVRNYSDAGPSPTERRDQRETRLKLICVSGKHPVKNHSWPNNPFDLVLGAMQARTSRAGLKVAVCEAQASDKVIIYLLCAASPAICRQ